MSEICPNLNIRFISLRDNVNIFSSQSKIFLVKNKSITCKVIPLIQRDCDIKQFLKSFYLLQYVDF